MTDNTNDKVEVITTKKQVDLYDFDKTLLPFDSGFRYWGYCMLHNPWILVFLPIQCFIGTLMGLKIYPINQFKKVCFFYVNFIDNEKNVKKFWDKYEKSIYDQFRKENRARESVIISASPSFLIEEIANRLGFEHCITSIHDMKTGRLTGKVCRRAEKVRRLQEIMPDVEVVDVYSDSIKSDKYIMSLGKRALLIGKRGKLTDVTDKIKNMKI